MTLAERQVLEARIKSFCWRLGAVMAIAGLNWVSQQALTWHLSNEWVVIIGLLAGEITKFINSNVPWLESQL